MSEFRYTSLFKEFDVDDVPIWAVHNPVIKEKDDTVDLGHFGRFLVGTTTEVINKRLCRGMPWEMPIAITGMELATRLSSNAYVLDLGANIGTITIPMAKAFSGNLISFEPFVLNADRLDENIQLNGLQNVVVRRVAVG